MLIEKILWHYDDITVAPRAVSEVNSRKQLNPYYHNYGSKQRDVLPIFASPMAAVVNKENMKCFWEHNVIPILPRTYDIEERLEKAREEEWIALSLDEFVEYFTKPNDFIDSIDKPTILYLLIDIAQGHMLQTIDFVNNARKFESLLKNVTFVIMVGNIGEPEYLSYILYNNVDIDYVRLCIGQGQCCITSAQTSINYPPASLVSESYRIVSEFKKNHPEAKIPYLVADGGIRTYRDITKALALGADFVMLGTMFSSLYESTSDFYRFSKENNCFYRSNILSDDTDVKYSLNDEEKNKLLISKGIYKRNFGMSTPEAQQAIDKTKEFRLTEGLVRYIPCIKTLKMWHDEAIGYMKSCMSYLGIFDIKDIQEESRCYIMSPNASKSINKPADNHINNPDFFVVSE